MPQHVAVPTSFLNLAGGLAGSTDPPAALLDADGPQSAGGSFRLRGFGFSIPSGERVTGFTLRTRARDRMVVHPAPLEGPPMYATFGVQLWVSGVSGTRLVVANQGNDWRTEAFGGPSDLLGVNANPASVNDPDFGVLVTNQGGNAAVTYMLDWVELTVHTIAEGLGEEEISMGTRYLDDQVTVWKQWSNAAGAATDPSASPTYRVYEEATDLSILTGTMARQDDANSVGFTRAQFSASTANGFEVGKSYCVRAEATVDGVAQAALVDRFVIRSSPQSLVWGAVLGNDTPGNPSTYGGALRRLLSKAKNRLVKTGDLVTTYADDGTTALVVQGYAVTATGFDRSGDA